MARYLSKYAGFKKTVKKGSQTLVNGPQGPLVQTLEEPIIALFQVAGVTPDERKAAAERFGFHGAATGEDPIRRISVWDTDEQAARHAWEDDLKARVEALLDAQEGVDYFRFEQPGLTPPWPNYDLLVPQGRRTPELVAKEIVETIDNLGLSREYAVAYERENRNRQDVVKALLAEPEVLVEA